MSVLASIAAAVTLAAPATVAPDTAQSTADTKRAICTVFGRYCGQALRVSYCESRWNVYARNGQYLGLFQAGAYARRYGFGWNAWAQARGAYGYFRASGYSWGPWTCGWAA